MIDGKPILLDTFSGAGGCSRGYQQAGFYVLGIDINPQSHYIGDDFIQVDALEALRILIGGGYLTGRMGRRYWLADFAVIHASPPCQFGSEATPVAARANHENLIPATRELLKQAGRPYVIENVEAIRSWLVNPIMLCGSMFNLPIWRHRYFEVSPLWFMSPAVCCHDRKPITVHSGSHTRKTWIPVLCTGGGDGQRISRKNHRPRESVGVVRWAMEIAWMTQDELTQAIPPAYTRFIGQRLMEVLQVTE